jgi:hypothetical protein
MNPEDYLVGRINRFETPDRFEAQRAQWRRELRDLLQQSFTTLNRLASGNAPQCSKYGVSSESMFVPRSVAEMGPSELAGLAATAARDAGTTPASATGAFRCLAVPGNILDRSGALNVVRWARGRDMSVQLIRPLSSTAPFGPVDLSNDHQVPYDQTPLRTYDIVLRECREWFVAPDPEVADDSLSAEDLADIATATGYVQGLISQIDSQIKSFLSPMHWEHDLVTKIAPAIRDKLEAIDETSSELISAYLHACGGKVMHLYDQRVLGYVRGSPDSGGAGYGEASTSPSFETVKVSMSSSESLRSFALRWCKGVLDAGLAEGIVLHGVSEAEALAAASAVQT